jgi:hypothetical protein
MKSAVPVTNEYKNLKPGFVYRGVGRAAGIFLGGWSSWGCGLRLGDKGGGLAVKPYAL